MGADWPMMTLRDAGIQLIDCVHKTPPACEDGFPYVSIPEMKDGYINLETARKISKKDYLEWTLKAAPQPNDIVLSRRCNPGVTAYVPSNKTDFALGQNLVLLRSDGSHIYPPLLRWITRSHEWWDQIRKFINVGAVFDSLRCADIPNFKLTVPPPSDQRSIAEILASLDDKIEQNRRTNNTLEFMAQTIFKAWFVDFEPVKAKAAGATRFPGMSQEVFDRLPDKMVETELGAVPEGWAYVPIGDLVEVVGGATPSTKNLDFWAAGDNPFCTPKDMSRLAAPVLLDTERHITKAGVDKISSGQLPVGTILLSSRAPIGYLAIAATPVSVNQGIIAMLPGEIPSVYVLLWTEFNMEVIKSRAGGSTFAEISKRNFRPIPALKPDQGLLSLFGEVVQPLFGMIISNERESGVLARIRDTLLPKLISGELRVPDHLEAANGG